ncbi:LysM peptidoglycan-binding domain-containing protein [Myceligenerans pegani]|uniref:LysM domain-containing protein n=1 Tax=Myceligenerans pegani TaxID=2776917 RepID=A0ABR9N1V3_9MICO|nr:hypothetical protein [Myceligenerans sp. TRM 65318]MBE1877256.1 hypothetical protein [Myceligenerans sp. TRM 65318]MBE3019527.1 hypothetical protein [Myceligenerans sp. TRM 65318]
MSRIRHLITLALAVIAAVLSAPTAAAAAADGEDVKYYVVQDKGDAEPEFLFEIAQRYLGDGERYTEIFELNEGRVQPDGTTVTTPEVLLPGWILLMPDDAEGDGIRTGPLLEVTPPAAEPGGAPGTGEQGATAPGATDAAAPDAGDDGAGPAGWLVPALITLGALLVTGGLAAGVVLLLRRRRAGRTAEPFDDSLLRTDTSSAWMTDRALRVLVAACERGGIEVPVLTAVFIEGPAMRLRLQNPHDSAPAPWIAGDGGTTWTAQIARLQAEPASDGQLGGFSRLVTLGVGESGRVMIDFARARGIISLDGSTRARHEALRRWLGELTSNPWSGSPRVVMVGNGLPQQETAEHVAGLEQVVPELVLGEGGVLVLSQAPVAAQQELLNSRFADPRFSWVVIVLGQVPVARWRFTARDDGWLRSDFLPDVRFDEQTAVRRVDQR